MFGQEIRTYNINQLKETNELLEQFGAKVYFLSGWEFFSVLLKNIDFFRNRDNGSWYSACQVGISRSDKFNQLIRLLGLGSTSRTEKSSDPSKQGMTLWDMLIKIAAGKISSGLLYPDGFQAGFNRVVFFIREGDVKKEQVMRLVTSSMNSAKQENKSGKTDVIFFIVESDETEALNMMSEIEKALGHSVNPEEIMKLLADDFNPQQGIINFNASIID